MSTNIGKPVTYQQDPSVGELRLLLQQVFVHSGAEKIYDAVMGLLRRHPLQMDDFPGIEGTYSRTILHRQENGYQAMVARWSRGTLSTIHGHPAFVFYYVIEGKLTIDNYLQKQKGPGSEHNHDIHQW